MKSARLAIVALAAIAWVACGKTASESPPAGGVDAATADAGACPPFTGCSVAPGTCPLNEAGALGDCDWSCGHASLCGDVIFTTSGSGCGSSGCSPNSDASSTYSVNEANARCILAAMRDGTRGRVHWERVMNDLDVSYDYQETDDIIDERQTYGWWASEQTGSISSMRYAGRRLNPASYFQSCLDSNDVNRYLSCMQSAFVECF